MMLSRIAVLLCVLVASAFADSPAHCNHQDMLGVWRIYEGERTGAQREKCDDFRGPIAYTKFFELKYPNLVEDEYSNTGFWTSIYNQGFEIVINDRKYIAYFAYSREGGNIISDCNSISHGWSHGMTANNWACYSAQKIEPLTESRSHQDHIEPEEGLVYKNPKEVVDHIHRSQNSWRAHPYDNLHHMKTSDYIGRSGGMKSPMYRGKSVPQDLPDHVKQSISQLPAQYDWRNVKGGNYITPVREQGTCGSCFAFAVLDMLSSRLRIDTNNRTKTIFSPQDIISCSETARGCNGGNPYLTAKSAHDYGIVSEECYPYTGKTEGCEKKSCHRYYASNYSYVGGYMGGCNEDVMKLELVNNGPIAAGIDVNSDFHYYKTGIYHHTGYQVKNPKVPKVNHAVLVVGYGVDSRTGEKFWSAKNSYGEDWGEAGYLRIRRGTNECNIESVALAATLKT